MYLGGIKNLPLFTGPLPTQCTKDYTCKSIRDFTFHHYWLEGLIKISRDTKYAAELNYWKVEEVIKRYIIPEKQKLRYRRNKVINDTVRQILKHRFTCPILEKVQGTKVVINLLKKRKTGRESCCRPNGEEYWSRMFKTFRRINKVVMDEDFQGRQPSCTGKQLQKELCPWSEKDEIF